MTFQCSDLDRALEDPELLPDIRVHAQTCPQCREQLHLWEEISAVAPQLREEWESPELWRRILAELIPTVPRRSVVPIWRWAAAAVIVLAAALLSRPWRTPDRDFLTDDGLQQVKEAEAAYVRSIKKLSKIAGPELEQSLLPLAAAYREKLIVLDSEIADIKAAAESNRYRTYVQKQLASLYREKQKTLREWLEHAKSNAVATD